MMSWVSTGSSLIHLDLVILLLVPDMAAARPRALQSRPVDLHTGSCPIEIVLLSCHGIPVGHTDLLKCSPSVHSSADSSHVEVLLLGGESQSKKWNNTKGTWLATNSNK